MAVGSGCRPRNPEAAQQLVRRLGGERLELPSGCARRADPHAAFQSSAAVPGRRYGRRSRLHRLYVVPIVHIKKKKLFDNILNFFLTTQLDQNKSLLPNFEITEAFFDMKVREYIHRYNYTYNPDGVFRAIKYMYTYWPDPRNTTHIRQQLINVIKTLNHIQY